QRVPGIRRLGRAPAPARHARVGDRGGREHGSGRADLPARRRRRRRRRGRRRPGAAGSLRPPEGTEEVMTNEPIVILGAGSTGEARVAAPATHEPDTPITVVERELAGGECSYFACMPTKGLL